MMCGTTLAKGREAFSFAHTQELGIYKKFIRHRKHTDYTIHTNRSKKKKVHYASSTANSQYKRYCLLNR
jgi:hypothetical protein